MTKLTFEQPDRSRYASRAGSSRKDVDAVKNVNLEIESGATLGLAGESGKRKVHARDERAPTAAEEREDRRADPDR